MPDQPTNPVPHNDPRVDVLAKRLCSDPESGREEARAVLARLDTLRPEEKRRPLGELAGRLTHLASSLRDCDMVIHAKEAESLHAGVRAHRCEPTAYAIDDGNRRLRDLADWAEATDLAHGPGIARALLGEERVDRLLDAIAVQPAKTTSLPFEDGQSLREVAPNPEDVPNLPEFQPEALAISLLADKLREVRHALPSIGWQSIREQLSVVESVLEGGEAPPSPEAADPDVPSLAGRIDAALVRHGTHVRDLPARDALGRYRTSLNDELDDVPGLLRTLAGLHHRSTRDDGQCAECDRPYPCRTVRVLDPGSVSPADAEDDAIPPSKAELDAIERLGYDRHSFRSPDGTFDATSTDLLRRKLAGLQRPEHEPSAAAHEGFEPPTALGPHAVALAAVVEAFARFRHEATGSDLPDHWTGNRMGSSPTGYVTWADAPEDWREGYRQLCRLDAKKILDTP